MAEFFQIMWWNHRSQIENAVRGYLGEEPIYPSCMSLTWSFWQWQNLIVLCSRAKSNNLVNIYLKMLPWRQRYLTKYVNKHYFARADRITIAWFFVVSIPLFWVAPTGCFCRTLSKRFEHVFICFLPVFDFQKSLLVGGFVLKVPVILFNLRVFGFHVPIIIVY